MSLPFSLHKKGLSVSIRLTPAARTSGFQGLADIADGKTALKFSVNTPPEDGKANKALIVLLAKEWKLQKSSFSLLSGDTNRNKVVLIEGDGAALMKILSAWLTAQGG